MTALKKNTVRCPHCRAETNDNDDLCKVCGKAMVSGSPANGVKGLVRSGFSALKGKIRPITSDEELEEIFVSADYSNPANPIWDD